MTSSQGVYKYPDGEEYKGEWLEGKRHGVGELYLSDGSKYSGQFDSGLCSGHGTLLFADGSRYEGQFQQGRFDGLGVFTRPDGMLFEGEFKQGKVNGLGLLTFADGTHGLPRNEGLFDGTRLVERQRARDIVTKAKQAAQTAKNIQVRV
ncbi:MORN repeat-containing protein 4-like [Lytechinus pictus]|uniref:MORN repeat-containing protein 4-like n=1 Tax=Lytechinus pictus TaxID=7653 RepID=UPI00240E0CEE|nr:MORN repeat-containing protein 4-like [Lytechinus pictus]